MYLWERARRPDPDYLKWVGVGRGYTTADAQYQIEKVTAIFGPYGAGWGIDKLEYDVVYGPDKPSFDKESGQTIPPAAFPVPVMVILKGELWWNEVRGQREVRSESGIITQTLMPETIIPAGRFPLVTSMVWSQDSDLLKKVSTDLQSKALSKIGVDGDLFKGLWGKEGSKKGSLDPVVYLGKQPLLDIPKAKQVDIDELHSAIKKKGLDDEQSGKVYQILDGLNWNHFAVRTMVKKLSEKSEK